MRSRRLSCAGLALLSLTGVPAGQALCPSELFTSVTGLGGLFPIPQGDNYASDVDLFGDRLLVGKTDVLPPPGEFFFATPSAGLFQSVGGTWTLEATLWHPGPFGAVYGEVVALAGENSSPSASSGAYLAGPTVSASLANVGAAATYPMVGGSWVSTGFLNAPTVADHLPHANPLHAGAQFSARHGSRQLDLPDDCQMLSVDVDAISLAAGGTQSLTLQAGAGLAEHLYLLLGSASGTEPGTPLGPLVLPLNWDEYLLQTAQSANQAPFVGTFGLLDSERDGAAAISLPPGFPAALAGLTLHHAYLVADPQTAGIEPTSNAMPLRLDP